MSRILRDRATRGSVGLLVFALFLLSVFAVAMPAQAATGPATMTGQLTKAEDKGNNLYDLTITLTNTTAQSWQSVAAVYLRLLNADNTSQVVYAQTYYQAKAVADQSGNVVLTIYGVYLPAGYRFANGETVTFAVYTAQGVYTSVYLDVPVHPPSGGAGGGITPPGETVETPVGTITIDPTSGAANLQVDPTKLAQQVTSAPVVTITIPADVTVAKVSVALPASAIQNLVQQGKGLEIQGKGLDVQFPQATLNLPGLQAGASLVVTVAQASADQSQQLLGSTPAGTSPGYRGTSNVYTLELGFKSSDGQTTAFTGTFPKPVTVGFTYDSSKLGTLPTWKLGAYRIDPTTGSIAYVGGRVRGDQVQADLAHFSNYAVLTYDLTFRDVPAGYWAKENIEMMGSKHVVNGVGADLFAPEQNLTRAQMAAMLVRALGLNVDPTAAAPFSDVRSGQWFTAEVAAAYRAGLVYGYPDGSFQPNRLVSRQEIAVMLVRAARLRETVPTLTADQAQAILSRFADRAQVATWARVETAQAVQLGFLQGRTPTALAPAANTKRAEAATLMRRVMEGLSII